MDQIDHHLRATEEEVGEIDFMELIKRLYDNPPLEPFSLRLEAVDQMSKQDLQNLLGRMLMVGAKKLFNKMLEHVTDEEYNQIRKYFYSIGFDFENELKKIEQEVTDYHPDGTPYQRTITVNNWQFSFNAADISMHPRANISKLATNNNLGNQ